MLFLFKASCLTSWIIDVLCFSPNCLNCSQLTIANKRLYVCIQADSKVGGQ